MNFLRFLLNVVLLLVVLAVLLAITAFIPGVQTWAMQWFLPDRPGLHATVGSFLAEWGRVEMTDVKLDFDGATLKAPTVTAALPVANAAWQRNLRVSQLVAKGWTLDLSRFALPAEAAPEAAAAGAPASETAAAATGPAAVRALQGWLRTGTLPGDVTLDGVDLEGDVLVPLAAGKDPARVHLVVTGGGLAPGHEGSFAVTATMGLIASELRIVTWTARGTVTVALATSRSLQRLEFKGTAGAQGGSLPDNLLMTTDLALTRGSGEASCSLAVGRAGQPLAALAAHFPDGTSRIAGTWKVDGRDSDLAPFVAGRTLPKFALAGDGEFETESALAQVRVTGHLGGTFSGIGAFAPVLERLGEPAIEARFEVAGRPASLRVARLDVAIGRPDPVLVLAALQPFEFSPATARVRPANPQADWLEASVRAWPLARLEGLTGPFRLSGGNVAGDFRVRWNDEGWAVRPKVPLTATGVVVHSGGRILAQNLDLTLALQVDAGAGGWSAQWSPLTIASGGRQLAASEGKATRAKAEDEPIALSGKWTVDLAALSALSASAGVPTLGGRSASGDFSASLGASAVVEGNLSAVGRDPANTVAATVRAETHDDGRISFHLPLKIAFGSKASEIAAEGAWGGTDPSDGFDVKLTGADVSLDQVLLLAAPLAAAKGMAWPAFLTAASGRPRAAGREKDRSPFWGVGTGRVSLAFDRLRTATGDYEEVGATFDAAPGALRLTGGRLHSPHQPAATLNGTLAFTPTADRPYALDASLALEGIDAAAYFGTAKAAPDAEIEGHFSLAGTLTGMGRNGDDLAGQLQEEYHLKSASSGGIIRLLKTSVAEAIPQVSTPVSDAVGGVGSFVVGSIFGMKQNDLESNKNPISKNADAVLNFTTQVAEIGYDRLTLTAVRHPDGAFHLRDIALTAPDERLTGHGEIAAAPGRALADRPLTLDLELGARHGIADLLRTAGLLSTQRDGDGFYLLNQPVHFGGTWTHLDTSDWHSVLVKAATRPAPPAPKKGG